MRTVFAAGLSMGSRVKIVEPGGRLGKHQLPKDAFGVATICSFAMNGVFLDAGIPPRPCSGGFCR